MAVFAIIELFCVMAAIAVLNWRFILMHLMAVETLNFSHMSVVRVYHLTVNRREDLTVLGLLNQLVIAVMARTAQIIQILTLSEQLSGRFGDLRMRTLQRRLLMAGETVLGYSTMLAP
jgi:hypothetical protein